MQQDPIRIRPLADSDHADVVRFVVEEWGAPVSVAHGTVFHPAELPGFIAHEPGGGLAGLLTYTVERGAGEVGGGTLEIVTLNASRRLGGVGTALVERAVAEARRRGCHEVRLTTTNDNVDALRFYQRRGFRLAELRPGAVAESRKVKPEIPETGDYGIPLRDELDLVHTVLPLLLTAPLLTALLLTAPRALVALAVGWAGQRPRGAGGR